MENKINRRRSRLGEQEKKKKSKNDIKWNIEKERGKWNVEKDVEKQIKIKRMRNRWRKREKDE